MFPGVTTYVLTLCELLLQQSAFSKYSGQTSLGLKFSDSFLSSFWLGLPNFFLSFELLLEK